MYCVALDRPGLLEDVRNDQRARGRDCRGGQHRERRGVEVEGARVRIDDEAADGHAPGVGAANAHDRHAELDQGVEGAMGREVVVDAEAPFGRSIGAADGLRAGVADRLSIVE